MAENTKTETDPIAEMLLWVKAAVIPGVKDRLDKTLTTTPERRAYDAADGTKANKDLATIAGKSAPLVSAWSKKWRQRGLASLTANGKLKHLQSLEAFGLEIEVGDDED